MTQATFDIDQMILDAHLEQNPWTGSPLHFTTAWYPLADHKAAWQRWIDENGHHGCIPRSHMWHTDYFETSTTVEGHTLTPLSADVRCECRGQRGQWIGGRSTHPLDVGSEQCQCIGGTFHQAHCDCGWHVIAAAESTAVVAWHDHVLPGWRELPILPAKLDVHASGANPRKIRPQLDAWLEQNYPAEMRQPGAPVITQRGKFGNRHVPGRSPFGGYDLSHTALDTEQGTR